MYESCYSNPEEVIFVVYSLALWPVTSNKHCEFCYPECQDLLTACFLWPVECHYQRRTVERASHETPVLIPTSYCVQKAAYESPES